MDKPVVLVKNGKVYEFPSAAQAVLALRRGNLEEFVDNTASTSLDSAESAILSTGADVGKELHSAMEEALRREEDKEFWKDYHPAMPLGLDWAPPSPPMPRKPVSSYSKSLAKALKKRSNKSKKRNRRKK